MSQAEIDEEMAKEANNDLEVVPENWAAFWWFIEVSEFWIWSKGYRVALDIQTIMLDASITKREYTSSDYVKLKELGRHASAALAKSDE